MKGVTSGTPGSGVGWTEPSEPSEPSGEHFYKNAARNESREPQYPSRSVDGVAGRNSGSHPGYESPLGSARWHERATNYQVAATRQRGERALSWPKASIDIRALSRLDRQEAVTHYQEAARWVHTLPDRSVPVS